MNKQSIVKMIMSFKLYLDRSKNYLTIFNTSMLLFLFLEGLYSSRKFILFNPSDYFIWILSGGLVLFIFFGWIEVKYFKAFQAESDLRFKLNPFMIDLKSKVDKLLELRLAEEKKQ